ncbi:MAG: class I SAM-dependent methyltransferase [Bacillota bacterium]|nr:class I SAM-dependent methyltransferase [Bacillota bacterium]
MFNNIPEEILNRMEYLFKIDEEDRKDGTPRLQRLRQIPPDTGKFIALLLASSPEGIAVEIGTSAGYSTMWLGIACREVEKKLYTFELLEEKIKLAEETFSLTKLNDVVILVKGDALENIDEFENISFCFLDAEKSMYYRCYEKIIPKLVKGGILVADNAINHYEALKPMIEMAMDDDRVDSVVVPIGKGELICRKR